MQPEYAFYCPRCQIGRCHLTKVPFVRLYQGLLISAPDTPAFVCDVCGYQEYEQDALALILALAGEHDYEEDDFGQVPTNPNRVDAPDNNSGSPAL